MAVTQVRCFATTSTARCSLERRIHARPAEADQAAFTMLALPIVPIAALMATVRLQSCSAPCLPRRARNRRVLVTDRSCVQMDRVPLLAVNARCFILAECWALRPKFAVRMELAIWPTVVARGLPVRLAGSCATPLQLLMDDVCLTCPSVPRRLLAAPPIKFVALPMACVPIR